MRVVVIATILSLLVSSSVVQAQLCPLPDSMTSCFNQVLNAEHAILAAEQNLVLEAAEGLVLPADVARYQNAVAELMMTYAVTLTESCGKPIFYIVAKACEIDLDEIDDLSCECLDVSSSFNASTVTSVRKLCTVTECTCPDMSVVTILEIYTNVTQCIYSSTPIGSPDLPLTGDVFEVAYAVTGRIIAAWQRAFDRFIVMFGGLPLLGGR